MTRREAIQIIEGLFPADAPYENTATIGKRLLEQAKNWRDEPDAVLFRYAELCESEERRQTRGDKNIIKGGGG